MPESHKLSSTLGLLGQLHRGQGTRSDLCRAAQLAVQVEFTTIPAYLTAMYSFSSPEGHAFEALRSVVMEEMFHLNQAANLVVALGGVPGFTGAHAPKYPCYLPNANPNTTPLVGLYRASREIFAEVFAEIETPAPFGAPPQGDQYDSIAQLYEALAAGIRSFDGNPFAGGGPGRQRTDIYLGKYGGELIRVVDKESGLRAITQIVQQGEGAVPASKPLVPVEQWGTYNYYGERTDGTYGPITGTPYELSHFIKFRKVALSSEPFPSTQPIVSNIRLQDIADPGTQALATAFDTAYSVMLKALERAFHEPDGSKPPAPDAYFSVVFGLMRGVLPALARELMTRPMYAGGDASVGPNAAPSWTYRPEASTAELLQRLHDAGSTALKSAHTIAENANLLGL